MEHFWCGVAGFNLGMWFVLGIWVLNIGIFGVRDREWRKRLGKLELDLEELKAVNAMLRQSALSAFSGKREDYHDR